MLKKKVKWHSNTHQPLLSYEQVREEEEDVKVNCRSVKSLGPFFPTKELKKVNIRYNDVVTVKYDMICKQKS